MIRTVDELKARASVCKELLDSKFNGSDGKTYLGSTHNVPHSPSHLSNNNFDGHLCVHFPISMEKAKEIGPYATSHQETINEAWDKILAQYR